MVKRYERPLPATIPAGTRLVPVLLPDNDLWVSTFAGAAFETLRHQMYWQRDANETAKQVADEWQEVYEWFLTRYLDEVNIVDCTDVANCIDENTDVQNSIINVTNETNNETFVTPQYGTPYYPIPNTIFESNQSITYAINPAACGDINTYGAALAVVEWIADDITTIFELIEIQSNVSEVVGILTGAVGLPPTDILSAWADLVNFFYETGNEAWDLADSITTRNRLACAIWCTWNDCNTVMSMKLVYNAIQSEFDEQSGKNINSLNSFVSIIDEIISENWIEYTLFTGIISAWVAFNKFLQVMPFNGGVRTSKEWSNIITVGYDNGDAGYLSCDPCAGTQPCEVYVIGFENLVPSGLPNGWMNEPPPNLDMNETNPVGKWANERASQQTLRAANYPLYGLVNEDFVLLWAAYELSEPCKLTSLEWDYNFADTVNSKSQNAYALVGGYDFDNAVFLPGNSCGVPCGQLNNASWTGEIENVTHVLFVAQGVVNSQAGAPSLRFVRVN